MEKEKVCNIPLEKQAILRNCLTRKLIKLIILLISPHIVHTSSLMGFVYNSQDCEARNLILKQNKKLFLICLSSVSTEIYLFKKNQNYSFLY